MIADEGPEQASDSDNEQQAGNRSGEEHLQTVFGIAETAAQILFKHRAKDEAEQHGREAKLRKAKHETDSRHCNHYPKNRDRTVCAVSTDKAKHYDGGEQILKRQAQNKREGAHTEELQEQYDDSRADAAEEHRVNISRAVGHKQRACLDAVYQQTAEQQTGNGIAGDTERYHRDKRAADRCVIRNLGCHNALDAAGAELFGILGGSLRLSVGDHVGKACAHAGQKAYPKTDSERLDDKSEIVFKLLEGYAEALDAVERNIRALGVALGKVSHNTGHCKNADTETGKIYAALERSDAKVETRGTGERVKAEGCKQHTKECRHKAGPHIAGRDGNYEYDGTEAKREQLPRAKHNCPLSNKGAKDSRKYQAAKSANERAYDTCAERLYRLALFTHGIAVKAGGDGSGGAGDAHKYSGDKTAGGAAYPDTYQQDNAGLRGEREGHGQQNSDSGNAGKTGNGTENSSERRAKGH